LNRSKRDAKPVTRGECLTDFVEMQYGIAISNFRRLLGDFLQLRSLHLKSGEQFWTGVGRRTPFAPSIDTFQKIAPKVREKINFRRFPTRA
jgi:hypothetical protein